MKQIVAIIKNDLMIEWRSREIVYTMALFAVLLVVIFSFAMGQAESRMPSICGGIVWVVIAFSGTVGMSHFFGRDVSTMRLLRLSPCPRGAIYLAKLAGMSLFMAAVECVAVPLVLVMFEVNIVHWGVFVILVGLGIIGFASVGSLFAAGLMKTKRKDAFLGVLTYPIVMPALVAGAKGTEALLTDPVELGSAYTWMKLLLAFDVLFVVLSSWTFGTLLEDD